MQQIEEQAKRQSVEKSNLTERQFALNAQSLNRQGTHPYSTYSAGQQATRQPAYKIRKPNF